MYKMILILVVGAFITYGIINITSNDNVTRATENASDNYSLTKARNIANSTAETIFSRLGDDITWRVKSPASLKVFGGSAAYTVEDAFFAGDSLIKISILSTYHNNSKQITVYTAKDFKTPGFIPPGLNGAITANSQVLTAGTLTIDGRDHTMAGGLIAKQGTWGIWTTKDFVQKGASKVGGTYYLAGVGTDIAPTSVGYMPVVAQNQTYPGGFPTTPEEVLGGVANGYPQDILKQIAKIGLYGSQYVTNYSMLSFPLKGITYVELPAGDSCQPSTINGSGILIIHNKSINAKVYELNTGTFSGLMIVDDIVKIHTTIIGAIVSMTSGPSDGYIMSNGNGSVLYSKEAIKKATEFAATHSTTFRGKRVAIKYWFE